MACLTLAAGGIIGAPSPATAQLIREHDQTKTRSFHGGEARIRRSFQSDGEARSVLKQIFEVTGLIGMEDRILLRASSDTQAAEAFVERTTDGNDERIIAYNAVFMQELRKKTDNYWSQVAVLAHEVGHHVRFHTIIHGRNHEFELEADYQAGFIMRRLGAELEQAQAAYGQFPIAATETHPGRADRLQAVTLGWTDGRDRSQAAAPTGPQGLAGRMSPSNAPTRPPDPNWNIAKPPPVAASGTPSPPSSQQSVAMLPPPTVGGACRLTATQTNFDAAGRARFALKSNCGTIGEVTVRYGKLAMRQRPVANNGDIELLFDLFAGAGRIGFEVPGAEPAFVEAQSGRTQDLVKYVLTWSGQVDLDLHVLQYGARIGEADHVWVGRPRSLLEAQSGNTGFISSADEGTLAGDHAEVFTFLKGLNYRRGGMQLRADFKSRGDVASGPFCGPGAKAGVEYTLLRFENGRFDTVKHGQFRAAECGTRLTPDNRYQFITQIKFD